ncbi:hypothetical protein NUW58_g4093 [Xylaria curta]|uniref:Uncharacterized protein n=1 Tax=Xylaria curta TaxID=42375 RepID=A0ACC1PAH9_9PEZI|nr:hypothetical protein NUW58_g4093 [Xylaria curta]
MAFNLMVESFKLPFFHYVYVLALVPLIFAYVALTQPRLYNGFPAVAIDDKGIFKLSRAKDYFASNSKLILEKGREQVTTEKALDESIFPEPKTYRGRRFLGMRELPGQENKWQFVTTSPEHLSFGHGVHACPGRFFASNEIKVILCHMLLKYDWKLPAGGLKEDRSFGQESVADPTAVVLFKERNDTLLKQLQTEKQS